MENNKKVKIKRPLTKGVAKVPVVMQMEALECGAAFPCDDLRVLQQMDTA